MSDESTPDGQALMAAPESADATSVEPAPIGPTTDEPATDAPATDQPMAIQPVTVPAKTPRRSIARDVALVAVVFVAVFILLAGLLWLAVPSGARDATSAAPISTLHSAAQPMPDATAA